jgi:hypothetical protein
MKPCRQTASGSVKGFMNRTSLYVEGLLRLLPKVFRPVIYLSDVTNSILMDGL